MAVPTLITDLSATASSNSPAGGDAVGTTMDDFFRAGFAFTRQLFNCAMLYGGTAGGTANAITVTASPAPTAYAAGQGVSFIAASTNTSATTINANSLGAKNIYKITSAGSVALTGGEIRSGSAYSLLYDGTQFILLNGNTPSSVTLATPQASTSGTSIDFTSIPAGVRRVVVTFAGVSTNGTNAILIQLGDSGGVETSGYLGTGMRIAGSATAESTFTNGFASNHASASAVLHGGVTLSLLSASANTWVASGVLTRSDTAAAVLVSGSKSLSDVLDRVRITTDGGTDTFDAGTINIAYD